MQAVLSAPLQPSHLAGSTNVGIFSSTLEIFFANPQSAALNFPNEAERWHPLRQNMCEKSQTSPVLTFLPGRQRS
jgi:hypothetical protein